jgi:hypothetical protein
MGKKGGAMFRRYLYLLLLTVNLIYPRTIADTVGWTFRDRQFLGPAVRYIYNDTLRGVHIVYKDDYGAIRYNFKPRGQNWRFSQPVIVNRYPRNLGSLDIDITNGKALIATEYLNRNQHLISFFTDQVAGAGTFRETEITTGPQFNLVAAARFGYPKFAAIQNDSLYYFSRWSARNLGPIGPFPFHNIVASKLSSRLGCVWTDRSTHKLFFRETPDGGGTWYGTRSLSDSAPGSCRFSLFGASLVYDSIQPHLVLDLYDGANRGRIQLWHYCQYQQPAWSFITEFNFEDTTKLGRHTAALDRPSIGITRQHTGSTENRLYVVWEQFDPDNIDPVTGIARSDIWACASTDNGRTWTNPVRLTQPDQTSKRFPIIAEIVNDTLHILYFADQQAGCWELDEGSLTRNPVIYLRVPTEIFNTGIAESPTPIRPLPNYPTILTRINRNQLLTQLPNGKLFDPMGRTFSIQQLPYLRPGVYYLKTQNFWQRILIINSSTR